MQWPCQQVQWFIKRHADLFFILIRPFLIQWTDYSFYRYSLSCQRAHDGCDRSGGGGDVSILLEVIVALLLIVFYLEFLYGKHIEWMKHKMNYAFLYPFKTYPYIWMERLSFHHWIYMLNVAAHQYKFVLIKIQYLVL